VSDKELQVHINFDEEAGVWYVAKSDIAGLRLESDNPFRLIERIAEAARELMELNAARYRPALGWKPVFDRALDFQPV
jgi:hypothetical protein